MVCGSDSTRVRKYSKGRFWVEGGVILLCGLARGRLLGSLDGVIFLCGLARGRLLGSLDGVIFLCGLTRGRLLGIQV